MNEPIPLKRFNYRDSTKILYKVVVGITLIGILIILRQRAIHFANLPIEQSVFKLILACSVPLSILVRLYFWVRPRIFSVYELYEDSIVRVFKKRRESFLISEIESIRISSFSPRFLGGFTLKMKSGQKLMFLSALKNSHKILETICEQRSDLLAEERLEKYLRVSRIVDVSWKRMKEKLANWKLLIVKVIGVPIALATVQSLFGSTDPEAKSLILSWSEWVVLAAALALIVEAILNSVEEKMALTTVEWDPEKEKCIRHQSKEKAIAQICSGLFFVFTIGMFWLLNRIV